jgi:hypothetical protein
MLPRHKQVIHFSHLFIFRTVSEKEIPVIKVLVGLLCYGIGNLWSLHTYRKKGKESG